MDDQTLQENQQHLLANEQCRREQSVNLIESLYLNVLNNENCLESCYKLVTAVVESQECLQNNVISKAEECIEKLLLGCKDNNIDRSKILELKGVFYRNIMQESEKPLRLFQEAFDLDETNLSAKYNLGITTTNLKVKVEIFEYLLQFNPMSVDCLSKLGICYLDQSKVEKDRSLLEKALELIGKAEKLEPGVNSFNLGCVFGLVKNEVKCREYVEKFFVLQAKELESLEKSQLEELFNEPDLEIYKTSSWFKKLFSKYVDVAGVLCEMSLDENIFKIPFGNDLILIKSIKESLSNNKERIIGTTGWTIWSTSFIVLEMLSVGLFKLKQSLVQSVVLDLSCGLGLIGIGTAKLGAKTILTEVGQIQLDGVKQNLKANGVECRVESLEWGNEKDHIKIGRVDFVFATDLLYVAIRDRIEESLLCTLGYFLDQGTTIVFSFEVRQSAKEEAFLEKIGSNLKFKVVEQKLPFSSEKINELITLDAGGSSGDLSRLFPSSPEYRLFLISLTG